MHITRLCPERPARDGWLKDIIQPEMESGRVYAIAFDLDTNLLERYYGSNNWRGAYDDIKRELKRHNFRQQQGSVYFGTKGMTSVHCVLATQALAKRYSWFAKCIKDIQALRIEETSDLKIAIGQLSLPMDEPLAANE